jgi:hypothetical protein
MNEAALIHEHYRIAPGMHAGWPKPIAHQQILSIWRLRLQDSVSPIGEQRHTDQHAYQYQRHEMEKCLSDREFELRSLFLAVVSMRVTSAMKCPLSPKSSSRLITAMLP